MPVDSPTTPPTEWQNYLTGRTAPITPARDLYRSDHVANYIPNLDALTPTHIAQFYTQGYLAVEHAFTLAETQTAIDALLDLIYAAPADYTGLQFEPTAEHLLPTLTREQKQDAVRKLAAFVPISPILKAFSQHPKLIATLTQLMGEPSVLTQDMALLKPPFLGTEKPWHQDCAYFDFPPNSTIIGAWISLDHATPDNGCMHIIPGSHLEGPIPHFARRDWQICDGQIRSERDTVVPLPPGGLLLFHGLMQHGTPPNSSPHRRRALQFHYRPTSVQGCDPQLRLNAFGPEGKNVSC